MLIRDQVTGSRRFVQVKREDLTVASVMKIVVMCSRRGVRILIFAGPYISKNYTLSDIKLKMIPA